MTSPAVSDRHLAFVPARDPDTLPGENEAGEFAAAIASLAAQMHAPPWCSYLALDDGRAVGFGGFKSPPDGVGETEIGYLTFTASQGRGIASAMAGFLVETAGKGGARSVLAHTLPEASASTRVLEKTGFLRDGWGEDEDIGRVWRWRLSL